MKKNFKRRDFLKKQELVQQLQQPFHLSQLQLLQLKE
jgi:hypothetical protein